MDTMRWITPKEMAAILNVPTSWLYSRTRLGPKALPFLKVGKYVRFSPEQVLAFLEAQGRAGSTGADGVSYKP